MAGKSRKLLPLVLGPAVMMLLPVQQASANAYSQLGGYSQVENSSSSSAQVTFVVPTVACPNSDTQAIAAVALVETASGFHDGAGVVLLCEGGSPSYRPQLQEGNFSTGTTFTLPTSPVLAGDRVEVSSIVSAAGTSATLTDETQGWTASASGSDDTPTLAFVGVAEAGCTSSPAECLPVPQFTQTQFTFGKIDGVSLRSSGAVQSPATSNAGSIEASVSKLIQHGRGFAATWVSSCTPDSTGRC